LDEFRDALFRVWEHNPFFIQVSESMPGRRLRLPPICHLPAQGHTDTHNPYLKGFVVRGGAAVYHGVTSPPLVRLKTTFQSPGKKRHRHAVNDIKMRLFY
jgi:hypothetical protein